MKFAASMILLVLLALIIPFLLPATGQKPGVDPNTNLPWQIQLDAQGNSSVFGLTPGVSTLGDVRRKLGPEMELAIIATPDEVGSLEGYYNQVALGFVLGRLIITADLGPEAITVLRERALKAEHMESTTRRITLNPEDQAAAEKTLIRAISLIPAINLDEDTIIQRFGPPAEKIPVSETLTHLLYPTQGLDVVLDSKGKELFQYVAPREFARLREPLLAATAEKADAQEKPAH